MEKSSSVATLQVRLIDRFGDNGVIAVVICTQEGCDWVIDTWVMSCRVFNRYVEHATLNHLVSRAKAAGMRRLVGVLVETERNGPVHDLYARLGFASFCVDRMPRRWQLDVASYTEVPVPMQITVAETAGT